MKLTVVQIQGKDIDIVINYKCSETIITTVEWDRRNTVIGKPQFLPLFLRFLFHLHPYDAEPFGSFFINLCLPHLVHMMLPSHQGFQKHQKLFSFDIVGRYFSNE